MWSQAVFRDWQQRAVKAKPHPARTGRPQVPAASWDLTVGKIKMEAAIGYPASKPLGLLALRSVMYVYTFVCTYELCTCVCPRVFTKVGPCWVRWRPEVWWVGPCCRPIPA